MFLALPSGDSTVAARRRGPAQLCVAAPAYQHCIMPRALQGEKKTPGALLTGL